MLRVQLATASGALIAENLQDPSGGRLRVITESGQLYSAEILGVLPAATSFSAWLDVRWQSLLRYQVVADANHAWGMGVQFSEDAATVFGETLVLAASAARLQVASATFQTGVRYFRFSVTNNDVGPHTYQCRAK